MKYIFSFWIKRNIMTCNINSFFLSFFFKLLFFSFLSSSRVKNNPNFCFLQITSVRSFGPNCPYKNPYQIMYQYNIYTHFGFLHTGYNTHEVYHKGFTKYPVGYFLCIWTLLSFPLLFCFSNSALH